MKSTSKIVFVNYIICFIDYAHVYCHYVQKSCVPRCCKNVDWLLKSSHGREMLFL